ncbi:hypothetical protein B0E53_00825 [Micromonospora sp. MH33]|nr:hypothetical protein B0E53_00825 [Micromonospora sp. MH33]
MTSTRTAVVTGAARGIGAGVADEQAVRAAVDRIAGELATGTPEDIAHAVSFLVSEGAGFVSGQVLYVADGPKA